MTATRRDQDTPWFRIWDDFIINSLSDQNNPLDSFSSWAFQLKDILRKDVIEMVLATDMKQVRHQAYN